MKPQLLRLGQAARPVVIVDDCLGDPTALVDAAAALAPLAPAASGYYPGLRRVFDETVQPAWDLTADLLRTAAPFVAGAFDCDGFRLTEASFSMVTTSPGALTPGQRHPHFDTVDPDLVALIVYLFDAGRNDGTAFYRHEATGTEVVTRAVLDRFVETVRREAPAMRGYFNPGMAGFTELGRVPARFGRVGVWPGNLLHSGLVPADATFSPDPRQGRLTLNLFLKLERDPA